MEYQNVVTETQIAQIAETYYAAASMIDRHNRCRQQDLQLERNFSYVIGLFELKRHFLLSVLLILGFYTSQAKVDVLQCLRMSFIQD